MELNREQLRAIIFYNWKRGITYDQCFGEMSTTLSDNKDIQIRQLLVS
jgi:hypothetical protein